MVKRGQVYRNNRTGLCILITDFSFYDNIIVYILNKEPYAIIINTSIITEKYTLVANNYAAK